MSIPVEKYIERPLSNGDNKKELKPTMIVIHAMAQWIRCGQWEQDNGIARAGEVLSATEYLDRIGLSAHVGVAHDGTVIRWRADNQVAWHARGFNYESLGIEILVPGEHDYHSFLKAIDQHNWPSSIQLGATAAVVSQWRYRHGITRVKGHCHIDPERKKDPGAGFPWDTFTGFMHPTCEPKKGA